MTEKIDLIYSAIHAKCGKEVRQRDSHILTQIDLDALLRKTLWEGKLKTIELLCPYCFESVEPTDMEIFIDEQSAMRKKVSDFLPSKWKMILN